MLLRPEVMIAIALCALVTVIPRVLPFIFIRHITISAPFITWLRLLPPGVLAALLLPELLFAENSLKTMPEISIELAACSIMVLVALASKKGNFLITVFGGIAAYAMLQAVFTSGLA